MTIASLDGGAVSSTVFEPHGSAALGVSWNDVDAKYRMLMPACGLPELEIETSLTMIHEFRHLTDVSRLTNLLRVASD